MPMNITLGTALFPPDIAEPAPYMKELAKRLSHDHVVTVVLYGHLPESVPQVTFSVIDKRVSLPLRLIRYFFVLWRTLRSTDILFLENSPSVLLPGLLAASIARVPVVLHTGDVHATAYGNTHFLFDALQRLAHRFAKASIAETPAQKPERLPFGNPADGAFARYENSWAAHCDIIRSQFIHVTK